METIPYTHNHSERLDKFLVNDVGGYSRSQWQKAVKEGTVLVNNKRTVGKQKLSNGDSITILHTPETPMVTLPQHEIPILAETDGYIVINKPAGIPVHPDSHHKKDTIIQRITAQFPDITNLDPDNNRPGIVQRLDKDVSGVMLIARTPAFYTYFKKMLTDRKVYKAYTALVHGSLIKDSDTITVNIERSKKTGKMVVRPQNQTGKQAITQYEVLKRFEHFTLLKIIIHTGRTHQIRTVMRALDHPIVGDSLYDKKKVKANLELNRPFLHATTLGFTDLSGEKQTVTAPIPEQLQTIISELI